MKKTIYILLFTFITLFIVNTSYASTIDNDLVDTKIENISAEASEITTASDSLIKAKDTIIIIIDDGNGGIIIIIIEIK